MDINKVWLSGTAITEPVLTKLSTTKTPIAYFTLQINERFKDKQGVLQFKPNYIRVESLGKGAEMTARNVKAGKRYRIDGYIREDTNKSNESSVRIRTYTVADDESPDGVKYLDGVRQAKQVLEHSPDLETAKEKIDELLS